MSVNETILIIDDKQSNLFALEKLLEKKGRTLLTATTGSAGLQIALESEIDLIILDVQMPAMNGFEVAQILKSHKKTRDIPIIFASAEMIERHSVMKGFEEGAVDYLSKPLDPEVTKAKVSVLLKIQAQKKQLIEKNLSLKKAEGTIKALNVNLQNNLDKLEALNKELESFSYSVSHDLQAPLRAINGYVQILLEDYFDQLDDNGKKTLSTIGRNAKKMSDLINDLLEFSRLGPKELSRTEIDVYELVHHVINDIKTALMQRTVFKVNSLHSTFADEALLTQVWINLLSNAIKYSSKAAKPEVEIGSYKNDHEIIYFVKDNGVGFNMEFGHKLFGVFQRLHKSNEFEGTGVGLALVQRIINKHGGRVWAEGKVNEGATFYFSIPNK